VCTYDILQLEQYNTTTYNSFLHLLALKAGSTLARVLGDNATAVAAEDAYARAQAEIERLAGRDLNQSGAVGDVVMPAPVVQEVVRVVPFWNESIAPAIRLGRKVVIAAHGNSLRALIKHLDGVSDDDIVNMNIPTARPLVYELDDALRPIRHYYLGDAAEIEAAMAAVAAQGKAKPA
jgi:broad specificity phosphatase PhoE